MATDTFSSFQIADALERQGLSGDYARTLAYQIGDNRLTREQTIKLYETIGMHGAELPKGDDGKKDNSILADTILGTALVGGAAGANRMANAAPNSWANKVGNSTLGKLAIPGAAATAAMLLNPFDTGNFAERASTPETLANLGGLFAGGAIGNSLGDKLGKDLGGKLNDAIRPLNTQSPYLRTQNAKVLREAAEATKAAKAGGIGAWAKEALKQAPKVGAAKLAGTAAGRGLGGAIGSLGGPIGSVLLGTLGGYLAPKLMPGNSPTVEQDTGGARSDLTNLGLTAAGATALGLAVSPALRAKALAGGAAVKGSGLAKGVGEMADDVGAAISARTPAGVKTFNENVLSPFADKVVAGTKGAAKPAVSFVQEKTAPLVENVKGRVAAGSADYSRAVKERMLDGGMPDKAYKRFLKRLETEAPAVGEGLAGAIRF